MPIGQHWHKCNLFLLGVHAADSSPRRTCAPRCACAATVHTFSIESGSLLLLLNFVAPKIHILVLMIIKPDQQVQPSPDHQTYQSCVIKHNLRVTLARASDSSAAIGNLLRDPWQAACYSQYLGYMATRVRMTSSRERCGCFADRKHLATTSAVCVPFRWGWNQLSK